jgi:hypothetical protein
MKRNFIIGVVIFLIALLTAGISLISCGGGGGGGGGVDNSSSTGTTGTVAVFIKDGPTDQFDHIWVTVTKAELIPVSGSHVVIYDNPSGCKVDLLAYRTEDYLLTIDRKVPAGAYSKIRLYVNEIELDPDDNVEVVKLPSNKIDLNPRGTFTVEPGGTLSVRLDIDANKSIHVHPSKAGWYIFRPVIFVDIESGYPTSICPAVVPGTITRLVKNPSIETIGFIMELERDGGTLEVKLSSDTKIFGTDGEFTTPSSLEVGQKVKIRGKFDSSGALVASFVVIGDVVDVSGEVNGAVVSGLFPFTPFMGEELVGQRNVKIVSGKTLILIDCNTEVGPEAIQAGMVARVFAKEDAGGVLHAAVILLRMKEVTGDITAVSDVNGGKKISVMPDGGTTAVDVVVPSAVPIYIEGDGQVSAANLTVGRYVRVLIDPTVVAPLTAKKVFIEGQKIEGTVESVGTDTIVVKVDAVTFYTVAVPPGATIIDLRSGCDLVPFSTIVTGNKVVCFGLAPSTTGADYDAPVVLIVG